MSRKGVWEGEWRSEGEMKVKLPGDGDARVQVVELGSSQGDLFVLLTVGGLHLQLHQLLGQPLDRLLLRLYRPERIVANLYITLYI